MKTKCPKCGEKTDELWICPECGWCDLCQEQFAGVGPHAHCPKCKSPPADHEILNHDMAWHDGDVYCTKCNTYVRAYDAG